MNQTLDIRWLDSHMGQPEVLHAVTASDEVLLLNEVVDVFENFLRGCGYVINGKLDVVNYYDNGSDQA